MICLKLATRTGSFQVEVDATPADRGVANINYERKSLAVPGTRNTGTNYADSRYQLPQIDITRQTINLLENGRYNPTLKLCLAICHRLDSSLDQLFWEEPNCHF